MKIFKLNLLGQGAEYCIIKILNYFKDEAMQTTIAHVNNKIPYGGVKKVLLWILIGIVVIIGLAFYFTSGITDAARAQLKAIHDGDIDKAYSMTSAAFKEQTSLENFKKYVEKYPILAKYKDVSFNERRVENGTGYLNGTIEDESGAKMQIEFQLVKEENVWKIQGIRLSPAGVESSENSKSQASVYDILVNDHANKDGYVDKTKASVSKSAKTIYATAQVVTTSDDLQITSTLTFLGNGGKVGPISSTINKKGNVLKAFSFTRDQPVWPKGEYEVLVSLSNGASKTVKFKVE